MVACVGASAWDRWDRSMRKLVHRAWDQVASWHVLCKHKLTSIVVILMRAGFHVGRFQPPVHIAPKLNRLTVPSPSPSLTPLRTWNNISDINTFCATSVYLGHNGLIRVRCVYPAIPWCGHVQLWVWIDTFLHRRIPTSCAGTVPMTIVTLGSCFRVPAKNINAAAKSRR